MAAAAPDACHNADCSWQHDVAADAAVAVAAVVAAWHSCQMCRNVACWPAVESEPDLLHGNDAMLLASLTASRTEALLLLADWRDADRRPTRRGVDC